MKLRNKKTGETATLTLSTNGEDMIIMGNDMLAHITKLSELKDYEDYDDTKDHWCISFCGEVKQIVSYADREEIAECKEIGNYFETKEETEKALEKMKAWTRLENTITCIDRASCDDVGTATLFIRYEKEYHKKVQKDLDLLFGECNG